MTGAEAWAIIAPILGGHMACTDAKINELDLAYVTAFKALKEYDERGECDGEIHQCGKIHKAE